MRRFKGLFRINERSGYASGHCLARRMIDRHYTARVIVCVCGIPLGLDKKWISVDMMRMRMFVCLFVAYFLFLGFVSCVCFCYYFLGEMIMLKVVMGCDDDRVVMIADPDE